MTDPAPSDPTDDAPAPEVVTPDVVSPDEQRGGEVVPIDSHAERATAALEAATAAAVAMPGIAGRDEFLSIAAQARMLALSGAAQPAIRNNPYVAFHVAMVGRDLGISVSAAGELIDVISTQNGPRLSLSPQLLNGQIRRLGLGSIVPVVRSALRCIAVALEPHGRVDARCRKGWPDHVDDCECRGILGESEFTWETARTAGIVGSTCQPGPGAQNHPTNQQGKCGCNQGYRTYPERMLWWRAAGFAADDYFPEAGLGLYSPEELGAVVDDEGRPVDPTQVALPPGYEAPGTRSGNGGTASGDEPADEADVTWCLDVISGLDPERRAKLGEAWSTAIGVRAAEMTRRQARSARSLIRGMVKDADEVAEAGAATRAAAAPATATESGEDPGPPTESDGAPAVEPGDDSAAPTPHAGGPEDGSGDSSPQPEATDAPPAPEEPVEPEADPFDGIPEELVDACSSYVAGQRAAYVDRLLTRLTQPTDGDAPARRRRLVETLAPIWHVETLSHGGHTDGPTGHPYCPECNPPT